MWCGSQPRGSAGRDVRTTWHFLFPDAVWTRPVRRPEGNATSAQMCPRRGAGPRGGSGVPRERAAFVWAGAVRITAKINPKQETSPQTKGIIDCGSKPVS